MPPVLHHRDWRYLQHAVCSEYRSLAAVPRESFSVYFAPAASIALWILQHAPQLARREKLHILIAQAVPLHALDGGRWLQFLPWLLGRPELQVHFTLVMTDSPVTSNGEPPLDEADDLTCAATENRLKSKSWPLVRARQQADMHRGTIRSWLEAEPGGIDKHVDLCAMFSPSLVSRYPHLLSEDGILPLLRERVPMAFFSASEADQLVDVYVLAACGMPPRDPECWVNPWALPISDSESSGRHGGIGWAGEFNAIPSAPNPEPALLSTLGEMIAYAQPDMAVGGVDALLWLGEPIRARQPGDGEGEYSGLLWRLPRDVAVDPSNGQVHQIQDGLAFPVDSPPVPSEALEAFPGNADLLRRAIWATSTHRDHVAPFVQTIDEALQAELVASDSPAIAASSPVSPRSFVERIFAEA